MENSASCGQHCTDKAPAEALKGPQGSGQEEDDSRNATDYPYTDINPGPRAHYSTGTQEGEIKDSRGDEPSASNRVWIHFTAFEALVRPGYSTGTEFSRSFARVRVIGAYPL